MKVRAILTAKASRPKKQKLFSHAKSNDCSHFENSSTNQILFLQRTAGNRALEGLLNSSVIQAKLRINEPGDRYEQEADRVAEQVMRMPYGEISRLTNGNAQFQRKCAGCADGSKSCAECADEETVQLKQLAPTITPLIQRQTEGIEEKEEEPLQAKEMPQQSPETSPSLENQIDSIKGAGQPLSKSVRNYFEPRFGYDFSGVRIHTDFNASESARGINARAYTIGRDMVFGSGEYAPGTVQGKKLLAHELAHVAQQGSGLASRGVQRSSITYRQLTWDDFKGSVPAGSPFGAETKSGFDTPHWRPKREITDTGTACQVDKKKSTTHSAKVLVDPAVFDNIGAFMEQGKSWARLKYKDPDKHCDGVVKQCAKEIDKQAAQATKSCKAQVKPCQEGFDKGWTHYEFPLDGTTVKVTSKADCSTKLISDCEAILAKNQLFDYKDHNVPVSKAVSKSDCTDPKFKNDCTNHYGVWVPRILKHEQGHFDISNVMAGKAKADLKKEAAKYVATATGCGRVQANNEAVRIFNALNASSELLERGQKWIDLKEQAEKDYDDDTEHGIKQKEQTTWETNIADGLKTYDLNKQSTPPSTSP